MVKFLVDAQLPSKLNTWLKNKGIDTKHTTELPYGNQIQDSYIMIIADEEERIVITKDKDFYHHHVVSNTPNRLLYIATGNITNRNLLELFENHFINIIEKFEEGNSVVELNNTSIIVHE